MFKPSCWGGNVRCGLKFAGLRPSWFHNLSNVLLKVARFILIFSTNLSSVPWWYNFSRICYLVLLLNQLYYYILPLIILWNGCDENLLTLRQIPKLANFEICGKAQFPNKELRWICGYAGAVLCSVLMPFFSFFNAKRFAKNENYL